MKHSVVVSNPCRDFGVAYLSKSCVVVWDWSVSRGESQAETSKREAARLVRIWRKTCGVVAFCPMPVL